MPIFADFTKSQFRLDALEDRITNPAPFLYECAEVVIEELEATAPVGEFGGGTLKDIVTRRRGPYKTAEGWAIGVGDATRTVPRGTKAPRGTISEFLGKEPKGKDFPWAWWYLNRGQKEALARARKEGKYGGTPEMAPYLWVQEFGDERVRIRGQHFLQNAFMRLVAMVPDILRRHIHASR